jgi:hypothetical protein
LFQALPFLSRLEDEQDENEGNDQDANQNNAHEVTLPDTMDMVSHNNYGEWVTPYKTMFQIQYFNVNLWTSLSDPYSYFNIWLRDGLHAFGAGYAFVWRTAKLAGI